MLFLVKIQLKCSISCVRNYHFQVSVGNPSTVATVLLTEQLNVTEMSCSLLLALAVFPFIFLSLFLIIQLHFSKM